MFRRRNGRLIVRTLLALALLVSQGAAQIHARSHPLTDLSGIPTTQLCDECLCFAPLLTAAGGSQPAMLLPHADGGAAIAAECISNPRTHHCRAFQARAPPAPR